MSAQKDKKKEYNKKQREKFLNLPEEEKQKIRAKRREAHQKWLASLTPKKLAEHKQKIRDNWEKYAQKFSPEEYHEQRLETWRKNNRKRYDALTPEKIEERKDYNQKRRDAMPPARRRYERERSRKYKTKIKTIVINHYSNGTMRCTNPNCEVPGGASNIMALCIDHVNGGGRKQTQQLKRTGTAFYLWLIRQGFPKGYQVLCASCNTIKKVENKEDKHVED